MTGAAELMDVDGFLAFSEMAPGDTRHELLDGRIVTTASERAGHARVKNAVLRAFEREIAAKGLPCEAFPDGMAVRVDAGNVFEPDVTLRCGAPLGDETILIDDPLVVVEVASPSTQSIDVLVKLTRYFRNPSSQH